MRYARGRSVTGAALDRAGSRPRLAALLNQTTRVIAFKAIVHACFDDFFMWLREGWSIYDSAVTNKILIS